MLLPLLAHGHTVTYYLIAVFCGLLRIESCDFALPETFSRIGERITLAAKTKDDLLAPVCPVFYADM